MTTSIKMARGTVIFLAVFAMVIMISTVSSCSLTDDWKPEHASKRIAQAKIVVYGYVTAHYTSQGSDGSVWPIDQVYTAEMELYCTFKGGPLPDRINISFVGDLTSCSATQLPQGKAYITLLYREGLDYLPDDINTQTAAYPPTNANFYYVSEDPDVTVSDEACTNYPGNDTIPCFQTGTDHESCDGVGGLRASFAWYVLALLTGAYITWVK